MSIKRLIISLASAVFLAIIIYPIHFSFAASSQGELKTAELKGFVGVDRFDTAVLLSEEVAPEGAEGVIIANGYDYPDALSASALTGSKGWPILLTNSDDIPSNTLSEIARLKSDQTDFLITIIGGSAVVSEAVAEQLSEYGSVSRIAGQDRYQTNAQVYKSQTRDFWNTDTCILASGKSFADALAISPLAGSLAMPIVLVGDRLMDEQLQQLSVFTNIIIVGGSGAVSTSIESILKSQNKMITRLGGSDRYETALIVADYLIKYYGFEPNGFIFTSGMKFPDALASGHLSCKLNAPVLLVDSLTSDLSTWLSTNKVDISCYHQAGGSFLEALAAIKVLLTSVWTDTSHYENHQTWVDTSSTATVIDYVEYVPYEQIIFAGGGRCDVCGWITLGPSNYQTYEPSAITNTSCINWDIVSLWLHDVADDQYTLGLIDSPDPAKVIIHGSLIGEHLDSEHHGGSYGVFSTPHHIETGVDRVYHYKDEYVESGYWDTQQVWVESGYWS